MQEFSCDGIRRFRVGPEEPAHPTKVLCRLISGYRDHRYTETRSDRFGDCLSGYPRFGDRVHRCPSWSRFKCETNESCRVNSVHGGPGVGTVADVARRTFVARDGNERGDETVITLAVDRGSKSNARRANAGVGQGQRVGDVGDARMNTWIRLVVLGGDVSGSESEYTSGHDERTVRLFEHRPDGLDNLSVSRGGFLHPREVVVLAQVGAAVAPIDPVEEARGFVKRPPVRLGSGGHDRGGRFVGTPEAQHFGSGFEKLWDHPRADPARRPSHEYTHLVSPLIRG